MKVKSIIRKINKARFHRELVKFEKKEQIGKITHIQLEPTAKCNLHCITCSRDAEIRNYTKLNMSLEELDKVLSMLPDLKSIKLGGLGEPLMHPELELFLKKIHDRGVRIWANTNGTPLASPRVREIVLKYVNDMPVSFDSTNKEIFEKIRVGSNFDLIKNGTKSLVEDRNRQKANTIIGLTFVISHMNMDEMDSLYDLITELKLDYATIVEVENWSVEGETGYNESKDFVAETRLHTAEITERINKLRLRLLKHGILLGHKTSKERLGRCYWPFNSFFVNVEGFVMPCNIRMHKQYTFGNIFQAEKIEDVLNNADYINFRKAHMNLDKTNKICGTCPR
ncbi:MAG: radical SAM protein [Candidatus Aenigmarchaeota archaeon]|nr:radical SAM protein [Candidatus Aenigmarchaeota archaeon]